MSFECLLQFRLTLYFSSCGSGGGKEDNGKKTFLFWSSCRRIYKKSRQIASVLLLSIWMILSSFSRSSHLFASTTSPLPSLFLSPLSPRHPSNSSESFFVKLSTKHSSSHHPPPPPPPAFFHAHDVRLIYPVSIAESTTHDED